MAADRRAARVERVGAVLAGGLERTGQREKRTRALDDRRARDADASRSTDSAVSLLNRQEEVHVMGMRLQDEINLASEPTNRFGVNTSVMVTMHVRAVGRRSGLHSRSKD